MKRDSNDTRAPGADVCGALSSLPGARCALRAGVDAPAGPQRSWLLRQMELDTTFLRELNVLDYSLLMAFQRLHEDERGPGSSLVFRTARWAPHRSNGKNEVVRA